jgi:hypothetical protein
MVDEATGPSWDSERKHPVITENDWGAWTDTNHFEDKEYPSQSRSQQERGIRDRFYNTLLDLHLVFEKMPVEERRRVYDRLASETPPDLTEFAFYDEELGLRTLSALAGILYEASNETNVPLELVLQQGIRRVVEQGWLMDIPSGATVSASVKNITIEITTGDRDRGLIQSANRNLQRGSSIEDLTDSEKLALVRWSNRAGEFDPEPAFQAFEEWWDSASEATKTKVGEKETPNNEES